MIHYMIIFAGVITAPLSILNVLDTYYRPFENVSLGTNILAIIMPKYKISLKFSEKLPTFIKNRLN